MAIYNVSVTTVMLVEAENADDAGLGAEKYLRQLGVDVVDDKTDAYDFMLGTAFTIPAPGETAVPVSTKFYNVAVTAAMLVEAETAYDASLGANEFLLQFGVGVVDDKTELFESEPLDHRPRFAVPASGKAAVPVNEK